MGGVKCLCIIAITEKMARKTVIVPIAKCPVHGKSGSASA